MRSLSSLFSKYMYILQGARIATRATGWWGCSQPGKFFEKSQRWSYVTCRMLSMKLEFLLKTLDGGQIFVRRYEIIINCLNSQTEACASLLWKSLKQAVYNLLILVRSTFIWTTLSGFIYKFLRLGDLAVGVEIPEDTGEGGTGEAIDRFVCIQQEQQLSLASS